MNEIRALLAEAYALDATDIGPAPRGFVAETFAVQVAGGGRLFVKWLPTWASAEAFQRGLAVAERLVTLGVPAPRPVRTLAGALSVELRGRALAVFEFVEGERGAVIDQRIGPGAFNYDFDAFVALLASIHAATDWVGVELPRETFAIPWAQQFETAWRRTLTMQPASAPQAELQAALRARQARIETDWDDLQAMAAACRARTFSAVLTHGDLAGDNLIVGADGRLHPLDWDDPVLAPAERDAWFFTCDAAAETAFVAAYQCAFPGWRPDPLFRRYYLYWRFFQDILGYIEIILDDPSPDRQAWSLAELDKTCWGWLWPPMRALS
jgi:spectinomycin phosphotransferase